ncbi:MAG: alpha/beta hydrolase [Firmicutes bacterium]|nr:alpha/beta hydrolase [Bacillota bacterium]
MISEINFAYKREGERELNLTFLPPERMIYKSAPLYFIIPGGGWHMESRQSMIEFSDESVSVLRKNGFAVVSIDYRVTEDGTTNMYDILEDCFDAISYVCENSQKLGIDTDNVILSGHSAGAHLALMMAYAPHETFKHNYDFEDDFTVKCVAVMSAPTILYNDSTNNLRDMCEVFVGCDTKEEREFTSPITYVTPSCPPTLLCAGTSDDCVFASSSEKLYEKLKENNVTAEIKLSICGGHVFNRMQNGIEPSISMEEMQSHITDFILNFTKKY